MRLRSSQLVFLMLLVCSVQIRQEYALQLITDAISGCTSSTSRTHQASTKSVRPNRTTAAPHRSRIAAILPPAAVAAARTPWAMPHPASHSAAIASHTSLLRA